MDNKRLWGIPHVGQRVLEISLQVALCHDNGLQDAAGVGRRPTGEREAQAREQSRGAERVVWGGSRGAQATGFDCLAAFFGTSRSDNDQVSERRVR